MEYVLVQIVPPRHGRVHHLLRAVACLAGLLPLLTIAPFPSDAGAKIAVPTHVSYDLPRELCQEINPLLAASWKRRTGDGVEILQSHGGSTRQARAVTDELETDESHRRALDRMTTALR